VMLKAGAHWCLERHAVETEARFSYAGQD